MNIIVSLKNNFSLESVTVTSSDVDSEVDLLHNFSSLSALDLEYDFNKIFNFGGYVVVPTLLFYGLRESKYFLYNFSF